jgi:hypothetical protein
MKICEIIGEQEKTTGMTIGAVETGKKLVRPA